MIVRNRTLCHPIWSVIILMINQIGRPRILLITRMITDRIGLHSVLLPLLIIQVINKIGQQHSRSLKKNCEINSASQQVFGAS